MASVKGYRLLNLPIHESEDTIHQVYLREHNDKKFQGRSLFFGNIDIRPNMNNQDIDKMLRGLLKRYGEIDEVSISDISKDDDRARFAHVIFNKKTSLKLALQAPDAEYLESWQEIGKKLGCIMNNNSLTKSITQIKKLFAWKEANYAKLKEDVDTFMRTFDEEEARRELDAKEAAEVPDEDGFVTVTSK
jgi:hypothetical protein